MLRRCPQLPSGVAYCQRNLPERCRKVVPIPGASTAGCPIFPARRASYRIVLLLLKKKKRMLYGKEERVGFLRRCRRIREEYSIINFKLFGGWHRRNGRSTDVPNGRSEDGRPTDCHVAPRPGESVQRLPEHRPRLTLRQAPARSVGNFGT